MTNGLEELVLYFSLKYEGDFQKIYEAVMSKEKVDEKLKKELMEKLKCKYVTIFSEDYPEMLKQINCPPFVLFYYGDLKLLDTATVAVEGTVNPTDYGKKATEKVVNELISKQYTVVSGLGLGVNAIAHDVSIKNNGKTIAILGSGIDNCYPKDNINLYNEIRSNHLLLSEYPFGVAPTRQNLMFRGRLIAGITKTVIITEIEIHGPKIVTAGYALEQSKDIYCVPTSIDNEKNGCNDLIKNGANVYEKIDDLFI